MAANQADTDGTGNDEPEYITVSFPMDIKTEATDFEQRVFSSEMTGKRQIIVENEGRKKRICFKEEDDLEILDVVVRENPFLYREKWIYITEVMKMQRLKRFTRKNIRERVVYLINAFREDKLQMRSELQLIEYTKRLQVASDLKKYADTHRHLIEKCGKQKHPTVNPSKNRREKNADPTHVREDHGSYTVQVINGDDELSLDDEVELELSCVDSPGTAVEPERVLNESDSTPGSGLPTPTPPASSPAPLSQGSALKTYTTSGHISQNGRKPYQRSMDQELRTTLDEDKEYRKQALAVEMLKAENEKRRLISEEAKALMDYELETKRIKLKEQQLNLNETVISLMKECLERNQKVSEQLLLMIKKSE